MNLRLQSEISIINLILSSIKPSHFQSVFEFPIGKLADYYISCLKHRKNKEYSISLEKGISTRKI